jgi:NarL family two-component system response regulator LiaR
MTETNPIRVMIVDDHLMVRDGLKVFLSVYDDLEVVAEAADGEQAVALCSQVEPDVILMDVVMPNVDGPTATARVRESFPHVQVIALTTFLEEDLVQRAIKSGASGYLLKDVDPEKLARAIRAAYRGRPTIDSAAAQLLVQATGKPPRLGRDLTPREREVLSLLVAGMTNKEIAEELTLSPGTVRLHVSNILSKLMASNRTEAATLALQHKLAP